MRLRVFIILEIIVLPLQIIGLIVFAYRLRRISIPQKISGTANEPYGARLFLHLARTRKAPAAYLNLCWLHDASAAESLVDWWRRRESNLIDRSTETQLIDTRELRISVGKARLRRPGGGRLSHRCASASPVERALGRCRSRRPWC